MCDFFSFVTEPDGHGGERFYFDWEYRKAHLDDDNHDSHSFICKFRGLDENKCNKYEYNPLTGVLVADEYDLNSSVNDLAQVTEWVHALDFKKIVEPLIIKPIVNPFDLPEVIEVMPEQVELLKSWSSVWDSVRAYVRAYVRTPVGDSVGDSVRDSVWSSVWSSVRVSVRDSVRPSVWAYVSSFFNVQYDFDPSSLLRLWDAGLLPSFDGKTWRLHTGKTAKVIFKISAKELEQRNDQNAMTVDYFANGPRM
jgi:hypothetical protein